MITRLTSRSFTVLTIVVATVAVVASVLLPVAPSSAATAPLAPLNGSVRSIGSGQVALDWDPPSSDGGLAISSYVVQISPGCALCTGTLSLDSQTLISGLTNGVSYNFTVRAVNLIGTSPTSLTIAGITVGTPGEVSNLMVTASASAQVGLSWAAPSTNGASPVTGYTVATVPACPTCTGLSVTGTSTVITGLQNGVEYSFDVRARNSIGISLFPRTVTSTPSTTTNEPTSVIVTDTADRSVSLSWSPPSNNGGLPTTGYVVETSPSCGLCLGLGSLDTNTTVTGLTNGTSYTFIVRATNLQGVGTPSSSVVATPAAAPSAPTDVAITSSINGQFALSWNPPVNNGGSVVTGYQVQLSPACITCSGTVVNNNATVVAGLTNGVAYTAVVVAMNVEGTGAGSNPVTGTPSSVPGAPSTPTVTSVANETVSLSWTPPVDNGGTPITGYQLIVSPTCVSCTGLNPSSSSSTIAGLTNGVGYTISVRATNSRGSGAASGSIIATPATVSSAPTALSVDSTGNRQVSLSWAAPVNNGGSNVTRYRVETSPSCATCTGTEPIGTSTTVGGLVNGTQYSFSVVALNQQGPSAPTPIVTATPSTVASPPSALAVTSIADGSVGLVWQPAASDGGSPIAGYTVAISPACAACTGTISAGTETTIDGLTNGTIYSFTVSATNARGTSAASSAVLAIALSVPDAPTALTVDSTGDGQVALRWNSPTNSGGSPVVGYQVQISPSCAACDGTMSTNSATTISGLPNGVTHTFSVTATNVVGASATSGSVTATPATVAGAATAVTVVAQGDQEVSLQWAPPIDTGGGVIASYQIDLSPPCPTCGGLVSLLPTTTVTGLTNGVVYDIRVRTVTNLGTGPASVATTVTSSTVADAPTALIVTSIDDSSIGLGWTAPADDGGSSVTSYEIDVSPSCVSCTGLSSNGVATVVGGLSNGTPYTFTVSAINSNGASASSMSASATPATVPDAPSDPSVVSVGDESVSLTWAAPSFDGGAGVVDYSIAVSPPCPACSGTISAATDATVTGLDNGTTYSFVISARNTRGSGVSSASVAATPGTTPSAPSALSVDSVSSGTAILSWTAPASNGGYPVTGYRVVPVPACTGCAGLETSSTGAVVTGLSNGTSYDFVVEASNALGTGPVSNAVSATPATVPDTPDNPAIVSVDDASVELSWDAPGFDGGTAVAGYRLSVTPACPSCTGMVATSTSTSVSGLDNGTTYSFAIAAYNSVGDGALSTSVAATPATTPSAPEDLEISGTGNAEVTLGWAAPLSDGGAIVDSYSVLISPTCANCTGVTSTNSATTITGLTNGTQYTFEVTASNSRGTGPASDPVTATPFGNPSPPANPSVDAIGDASVELSWTAPAVDGGSPVTGYVIEVVPSCSGCVGLTSNTTSSTVVGLTDGIAYSFVVRAVTDEGTSEPSQPVGATPAGNPGLPTDVAVSAVTDGRVDLSWTEPTDNGGSPIIGYTVDVSPSCANCSGLMSPTTSTSVQGLTNGTAYVFRVRATNAAGTSAASPGVAGTAVQTPTEPVTPVITSTGNQTVNLAWGMPASTGASPIAEYIIGVSPACAGCTGTTSQTNGTTVSGLTNGINYSFIVSARNTQGVGPASNSVDGVPSRVSDVPTALTVAGTSNRQVNLAWSAPSNNGGSAISGYAIDVSPSCPGCGGLNPIGLSTAVTGLDNATSYTFSVRAVNERGSSVASSSVSAAPASAVAPPADPRVTARTVNSVTLAWAPPSNAGSTSITSYRVTVSPGCPVCTGLDTSNTSTTIAGLTPGTNYMFTVVAVTTDGMGATSSPIVTTTEAMPSSVPTPPSEAPSAIGYWSVASDGGIFAYGDARFFGSTGSLKLNQPIVGMARTPSNNGYWLVASDGGIFAFGDARFFGSTGGSRINQPIVGMSSTPSGNGYWLVASDGGIFAYGDARFFGSTGGSRINEPVVAMTSTPSGNGYWLTARDGGIFAFGDARFFGSTGGSRINQPIVGMNPTPTGSGYWLVASDGGIFAFGDARFFGSTGGSRINQPIVGMSSTPSGNGYWLIARDGGIFAYGDSTFRGSAGNLTLNRPIVGMASIS